MTKVEITRNDYKLTLTAKEHAGDPVVCAGISALCYALANSIYNHYFVDIDKMVLDDGDAYISVVSDSPMVIEDFRMAAYGFKSIESAHPDNIQVSTNLI